MEWVRSTWMNFPFGGQPSMRGNLRILFAIGNIRITQVFAETLQRVGCQVVTAVSGREVLEKAEAEVPDRILLFDTLPDISGFEVIEHLKESPVTATVPTMLVLTREQETDMRKGLLPQVDRTMTMPLDHKKLHEFLGIYPQ